MDATSKMAQAKHVQIAKVCVPRQSENCVSRVGRHEFDIGIRR